MASKKENEAKLATNIGQIYLAGKENNELVKCIDTLNTFIGYLDKEKMKIDAIIKEELQSVETLNVQKTRVKKRILTLKEESTKLSLQEKKVSAQLNTAQAGAKKAQLLAEEISSLKNELAKYEQMQKTQSQLGEITRKYVKQKSDDEVASSAGKEFISLVANKQYASEIVEASFDYCFDFLTNDIKSGIVLNKSSHITTGCEYEGNIQAVYRALALHLIRLGNLVKKDDDYILKLNKYVSLGYSKPHSVMTKKIEFGKNEPIEAFEVSFAHIDGFTILERSLPLGIDPVSIKWIISHFTKEEEAILYSLLMEPLIKDDHPNLIQALEYMKGKTEHVQKIRLALGLLLDLSFAIEKKFFNVLVPHWQIKANDDSVFPLKKEHPPITGKEKIANTPWKVKTEYLSPELAKAIGNSKWRQTQIFQNLTKESVKFPVNKAYSAKRFSKDGHLGINHQYYEFHKVLEPHGCLFTSLLALVVSDKSAINVKNVQSLKNSLVNYLNNPIINKRYQAQIESTHHLSVKQYQRWLSKGYTDTPDGPKSIHNLDMGDLEIKLVAEILNVCFGVFRQGASTKLNEFGLMVPGDQTSYFGPQTEEVLLLFNDDKPWTYCALWPKLNDGIMPSEVNQAHLHLKNYWESFS